MMTAQQLLLASAPAGTTSDSSSIATDEIHITSLLSRIANLSAPLTENINCAELTPTKRADLAVKLFNLEYRILVQRNQTRKLALQQEMSPKQTRRRRAQSMPQPLSETDDTTNDPVPPADSLAASDCSNLIVLLASLLSEQASTVAEPVQPSHNTTELQPATETSPIAEPVQPFDDTAELQPATEISPIDTTSHDLQPEQIAVPEVIENEETNLDVQPPSDDVDHLVEPISQEDRPSVVQDGSHTQRTDTPFIEPISQESEPSEPQADSHTQRTNTPLIEKKAIAKSRVMSKKKQPATNKKKPSSSRPAKARGRKR